MINDFFHTLAFSFSITGPIFVVLLLGVVLRRSQLINDNFVDVGSKLVFNVTLPALLFISVGRTSIEQSANLPLIGYGVVATLILFLALELLAARWVEPAADRGVVVQGAYRSNMGIIGLAYCVNAYGESGLVAASLYLGVLTILFNVLAVITLSRSLNREQGALGAVRGIARNPLIIALLLALPVAWSGAQIPAILLRSGEYFAQMTLPLALLCTGASLDFRALRHEVGKAALGTGGKLLLVPLVATLGAALLGFRDIDLGVLFLMTSAPTAAASYVMVRSMGGNAALAANIIVLTTLGSLLSTSLGMTLLRGLGLV